MVPAPREYVFWEGLCDIQRQGCIQVLGGGLTREHGMFDGVTSRDFLDEVALELLRVGGWLSC